MHIDHTEIRNDTIQIEFPTSKSDSIQKISNINSIHFKFSINYVGERQTDTERHTERETDRQTEKEMEF